MRRESSPTRLFNLQKYLRSPLLDTSDRSFFGCRVFPFSDSPTRAVSLDRFSRSCGLLELEPKTRFFSKLASLSHFSFSASLLFVPPYSRRLSGLGMDPFGFPVKNVRT